MGEKVYLGERSKPHIGYSIEISGDIYVGMFVVCQINCVGGITWTKHAHAQSQVLGCENQPVTPVLFISTTR